MADTRISIARWIERPRDAATPRCDKRIGEQGARICRRRYSYDIAVTPVRAANNLNDILIAQRKSAFTLSNFQTSFVQQAFDLNYFLVAIPTSFVTRSRYEIAIVIRLPLYATGALLFYATALYGQCLYFIAALFVIAGGLTFIETSTNPPMTELDDPRSVARRLNWAQAANSVGTISGVLIGRYFILSEIVHDERSLAEMAPVARAAFYRQNIVAVQGPCFSIGLVVIALAAVEVLIHFPRRQRRDDGLPARVFLRNLSLAATAAQFFYGCMEVGLWSYAISYVPLHRSRHRHNQTGSAVGDGARHCESRWSRRSSRRLTGAKRGDAEAPATVGQSSAIIG